MECCGCEICFVFYFCVLGAPPAARFVDARLAALRRRQLASVMCVCSFIVPPKASGMLFLVVSYTSTVSHTHSTQHRTTWWVVKSLPHHDHHYRCLPRPQRLDLRHPHYHQHREDCHGRALSSFVDFQRPRPMAAHQPWKMAPRQQRHCRRCRHRQWTVMSNGACYVVHDSKILAQALQPADTLTLP